MRRGIGVAGLQKRQQAKNQYKEVGSNVSAAGLAKMEAAVETFKENLEEFARKHRHQINKNPQFRHHFNSMCSKIGLDPLASQKGFWAELLGVGDFYYELAVKIIDVCLSTRPMNGGIIAMSELLSRVEKMRTKRESDITEDDLQRAIQKIEVLGEGFKVVTVGRVQLVQSVPLELSKDTQELLALAQSNQGYVTASMLKQRLGWSEERVTSAVDHIVKEGLALIDDQGKERERLYWFHSLMA